MSEQDPHKIDETFRSMIERMSLEPPATNLDGMRANVLQVQLGRVRTENGRLKTALSAALLLLGFSGYLLTKNTEPIASFKQLPLAQKTITVRHTDTVYITRTERVYVRIPIPEAIDDGPDLAQSDTDEFIDNQSNSNKNPETLLNEKTATLNQNDIPRQTNNTQETKAQKRGTFVRNERKKAKNQPIINNTTSVTLIENEQSNTQDGGTEAISKASNNAPTDNLAQVSNAITNVENKLLELDFLEPLGYSIDPHLKIPKIRYSPQNQTAAKPKKPRIPFVERLSISAYYAPEFNQLYLRRDQIEAFEYGHESITSTQVIGLRTGIKLSDKLTLLTGIENQTINFEHSGLSKEQLIAQDVDGRPTFFKKTVFGIAQLPNDFYTSNPTVGSSIIMEGDEDNFVQSVRVPFGFKYDFYNQKLPWKSRENVGLKLYALGGGYWSIPVKQEMKIEVYEPDGHDFYTTLTHFQNTKTHFGANIGAGAEINYGRQWHIFGEPYYQTGLNSMVQNLPIRTFAGGFGFRFGFKYQLKK